MSILLENHRNQEDSVSFWWHYKGIFMRFPIAADLESRDGTLDADALLTNAFAEVVGDDSAAIKRSGCAELGAVTAGAGQLLASIAGKALSVAGDELSTITVSPFAIDGTDALATCLPICR